MQAARAFARSFGSTPIFAISAIAAGFSVFKYLRQSNWLN
jgi:hypothetical protein